MNEMPTWLVWFAAALAFALVLERGVPKLVRALDQRRVDRNRRTLAEKGLTPEQYMATIDPTNYQAYGEAIAKFWVRRDRHERRDAFVGSLAKALSPAGAREARELNSALNDLNGRN